MRVARAAFFAGPALLLVAALVLGATFIADRRSHARKRRAIVEDDVETPAPAPRREPPAHRFGAADAVPVAPPPAASDSMRLRVDGPHGLRLRSVSVTLSPAREVPAPAPDREDGDDDDDGQTSYELEAEPDGEFVLEEIEPGRYDLTVGAEGLAEAHLANVPSDAVGVRVALGRPPILLGALGGVAGGCDEPSLQLEIDGGEREEEEEEIDADCTFAVEHLERGRPVSLAVSGGDGGVGATVAVPVDGDPPPVCLREPCARLPSAVVVFVADGDGFLSREASVWWEVGPSPGVEGLAGGGAGTGLEVIGGLAPGQEVRVQAGLDDREVKTSVVATMGIAEVVLTLPGSARDEGGDGDEDGDQDDDGERR